MIELAYQVLGMLMLCVATILGDTNLALFGLGLFILSLKEVIREKE